jgi:hypothetical protein
MKIKIEIDIEMAQIKRLDTVLKHVGMLILRGHEKREGTHRYGRYGYDIETPIKNCYKVDEIENKLIYYHKSKLHKDGIHQDRQENL